MLINFRNVENIWSKEDTTRALVVAIYNRIFFILNLIAGESKQLENIWRIGAKHPKSKQLLMRYATTADKKAKGAGARSLYYLIHGRPQQQEQKGVCTVKRQGEI